MTEQIGLALFFGPEPPCHRFGGGVVAVDAMDDPVELEGREDPVNRRPRCLDRVALAAKLFRNTPADFKARPARRKPWAYPPDKFAGGFLLDHEHADAMQDPMTGHDGGVALPVQLLGN